MRFWLARSARQTIGALLITLLPGLYMAPSSSAEQPAPRQSTQKQASGQPLESKTSSTHSTPRQGFIEILLEGQDTNPSVKVSTSSSVTLNSQIKTQSSLPTPPALSILSYISIVDGIFVVLPETDQICDDDEEVPSETPNCYRLNFSLDGGENWLGDQYREFPEDQGFSFTHAILLGFEESESAYVIQLSSLPPSFEDNYEIQFRLELEGSSPVIGPATESIVLNTWEEFDPDQDLIASNIQVAPGYEKAYVAFTSPKFTRGTSLNSYYVYTLDNGETWSYEFENPIKIPIISQTSELIQVDNLSSGTEYEFGVGLYMEGLGLLPMPIIASQSVSSCAAEEILQGLEIIDVTPGNRYLQVDFMPDSMCVPETFDVSTNGGISWRTLNPAVNWSPITVFGLENGFEYELRIRSRAGSQVGPASNIFVATPNTQTKIETITVGSTISENAFLQGVYAEVGIRDNGAFGSGGEFGILPPPLFHPQTYSLDDCEGECPPPNCLGFVVDRQKNGFAGRLGSLNIDDGDFFCPGTPYEGWGITLEGILFRNDDETTSIQRSSPMQVLIDFSSQSILWQGYLPKDEEGGIRVEQLTRLDDSGQAISIRVRLINETDEPLQDIYYQRSVDPDNHNAIEIFDTENTVVRSGVDNLGAQVKAKFDSGAEIFLSTSDSNARAAICPGWKTSSEEIFDGADYEDGEFNEGCTRINGYGDDAISLAWLFENIGPGEAVVLNFVYSLTSESAALPQVQAMAATGVGSTQTATLNGIVNPSGSLTAINFVYGVTPNLSGAVTTVPALESPLSGSSNISVSRAISGLTSGTTYYYRVVATNSTGTVESNIVSFTPIGTVGIRIDNIRNLGETTTTLVGSINPSGGIASAIKFRWSNDAEMLDSVNECQIDNDLSGNEYQEVTCDLEDLIAGSVYFYQLVVIHEGQSSSSQILSFTTRPAPSARIIVPHITGTSAVLKGFVNAYNNLTTSIIFQYSTDELFTSFSTVVTEPLALSDNQETLVSATISGLATGTTYYYVLIATNDFGSNTSSIGSFRIGAAPIASIDTPILSGLFASFSATVNPQGTATNTVFRVGQVADLLSSFIDVPASPDPITGVSGVVVTALSSSSFNPSSTYYVQAVAENSFGVTKSSILSFTTPAVETSTPTVVLSSLLPNVGRSQSFTINVEFSRAVTGFSLTDITMGGTSSGWVLSNLGSGVINSNGSQKFSLDITPSSATNLGNLTFVIGAGRVLDSFANANAESNQLVVSVVANPVPIITSPASGSIITGAVGEPLSLDLVVSGGTSPETSTVTTGFTLPPGLTLSSDGKIRGTPTTAGTTSTSFTVTDSLGETATVSVEFVISPEKVRIKVIPTYSVFYSGNAPDAYRVFSDFAAYARGEQVVVAPQVPERIGYTFTGWNTSANGAGTTYQPSSTLNMESSNLNLYAQWKINSYTLTFESNGWAALNAQAITGEFGSSVKIPMTSVDQLRPGYEFLGWNTSANGSGTAYKEGMAFKFDAANTTLFAQWKIKTYSIRYEGNGQSRGMAPETVVLDFNSSAVVQAPSRIFVRKGYTFSGWNSAKDGSGRNYSIGEKFLVGTSDLVFYADWKPNVYQVKFINSSRNPLPNGQFLAESSISSAPIPNERPGYTFKGWSATPSKTQILTFPFSPGVLRNVSLYAVWVKN